MVLLLGILLAFLIVDGVAIFFGSFISNLIPETALNFLAAGLFIIFGIKTLLEKQEDTQNISKGRNIFFSGFTLIFIAEWGDKTQLSSALFATRYDPVPVFIGVMAALTIISGIAVFLGRTLLSRFDRNTITKIAGIVFIILGISFLLFR